MKSRAAHGGPAFAQRAAALAFTVALAGCASLSPDGGVERVQALARERLGGDAALPARDADPAGAAATTRELLQAPLTAESAVRVALLNNPGLKADLAEVGISEADLVQAGRLPNPGFSFSNKRNGEVTTIERSVMFSVMALLTMPLAQEVAGRQYEAAQLRAAAKVIALAGETRRAYFSAVAAQQSVHYFEQVKLAAEAAAELAARMARIGNFNQLSQMREQVFYADATAQLAKARLAAIVERERLTRLLGLDGADRDYRLPERLPDLPAGTLDPVDAERTAVERRLDVAVARHETNAMAANLGLSQATRFVSVLEIGYVNENDTGEKRLNGYEIDIEIPLFDWGDARLARAEASYTQSVNRLRSTALAAQSEVRANYQTYRTTYDVARHYRDEVVPLRKRIAEENLLRYNGMLIGVFELLADAREQIASVAAYIDALRDFWIAETNLQLALNGTSAEAPRMAPAAALPGAAASRGH
jgi:outer membrane protein TolC